MKNLMPFDELNTINEWLGEEPSAEPTGRSKPQQQVDDELLDLFLLAYIYGYEAVNEKYGTDFKPDLEKLDAAVHHKIDGKDWEQRLDDIYTGNGTDSEIKRIAETEMHRIYNQAILDAGKRAGAKTKTWETMLDDRVRDSHDYLQSMTVPFNEDFYTYDGAHAPGPGMFGIPEEDINCRCFLTLD